MSCVTRIQQCSVFGIHKPLETKTASVEKDLIVEKYKANSSAVFWRLCFQTLMFYEWCLGTVEVARMWKEQTVQCQKQIMWLQVSLLAHHAESATRLRLEIPTRNIKLEIVLCWKQQGRGGTTAIHYSRDTPVFSRGFQEGRKSDFGMKVKQQRYLKTWLQSTENPESGPAIDHAALPVLPTPASRLPLAAVALPFWHPSPTSCAHCPAASAQPLPHRGWSQQHPVRQNQWELAAEAWFTQAYAHRRKPKMPRDAFFCRTNSCPSCLFLAKIFPTVTSAADWRHVAIPFWRYTLLRAAGLLLLSLPV